MFKFRKSQDSVAPRRLITRPKVKPHIALVSSIVETSVLYMGILAVAMVWPTWQDLRAANADLGMFALLTGRFVMLVISVVVCIASCMILARTLEERFLAIVGQKESSFYTFCSNAYAVSTLVIGTLLAHAFFDAAGAFLGILVGSSPAVFALSCLGLYCFNKKHTQAKQPQEQPRPPFRSLKEDEPTEDDIENLDFSDSIS